MNSFTHYNPTRIVFGRDSIPKLSDLVPFPATVLVLFGGGSIKTNGIYDKVIAALEGRQIIPCGGIEPNPTHEQCMEVLEGVGKRKVDFVLAVGGGSVIDAAKYIAAASKLEPRESAWDLVEKRSPVVSALPIGVVLTLPASGSEMNCYAVMSNAKRRQKRSLKSEMIFPKFSILDPEVTSSLSKYQLANGVIDAFSHVIEQYLTSETSSPLQDRLAEGILTTLLEVGPALVKDEYQYDSRATFMWAATCALNGWIATGVPQDWSSHWIGHELTTEFGMTHADTIAIVLPGVMRFLKIEKMQKLVQYGKRVFGIIAGDDSIIVEKAIERTEAFFGSLGKFLKLSEVGLDNSAAKIVAEKIGKYSAKLGEKKNIGEAEVLEILRTRT